MGLMDRWFGGEVSEDNKQDLTSHILQVPVEQIFANPTQPRRLFDEAALDELSASIQELGVIQPIVVRAEGEGRYELVAGERRLRATRKAGLKFIPAIVVLLSERESAEVSLVENLQRRDLHFFEEAESYRRIIELFGVSQDELAQRVGKSRSVVGGRMRLLQIAPKAREALAAAGLLEGHARAMLRLSSEEDQLAAVAEASGKQLSVRELERWVEARRAGFHRPRPEERKKPAPVNAPEPRVVMKLLSHMVRDLRHAGTDLTMRQKMTEKGIEVTILIPHDKE